MHIALIRDGICLDCAVFDCVETAEQFLREGALPGVDSVRPMEAGFGIGDRFEDGRWVSGQGTEGSEA